MIPSIENGQIATLENLFHSIQTRLNNIESCVRSNVEIENNEEDCMSPIKRFVLGYPYDTSAAMLFSTLEEIKSLVNLIKEKENYINAKATWRTAHGNEKLANKVLAELNFYHNELNLLLQKIADRHSNIQRFLLDISNEKIETNLNSEELGGLLYFLLIHQKDIVNTNAKRACEILSKVITTTRSSTPSSANLYNLMFQTPKKKKVIEFWRKKFNSFYNHPLVEKTK